MLDFTFFDTELTGVKSPGWLNEPTHLPQKCHRIAGLPGSHRPPCIN